MLEAYREVVPPGTLEQLYRLADALHGRTLQHINSTRSGGGVAEILRRLVPLMISLDIPTTWQVIEGTPEFFAVTKAFHNALQGDEHELAQEDFDLYLHCLQDNAKHLSLSGDAVMVHDPQPAYLIAYCARDAKRVVWRCHIDVSRPNERVWHFLQRAVRRYDATVFHIPQFAQDLPAPQFIIAPSIDPLSEKNRELSDAEITAVTDRFGIDRQRPLLVQISRFDRFKDPLGVIAAYRLVRQTFDCQLVLAGGTATDDPEGAQVIAEVREAAGNDRDIFILELSPDSHTEINALQRAATVILQKSTREGFGLTVSEGLWKGKPVIGGAVGGIPTQIVQGVNGFLVHSPEGAAFRLRYLLTHPRIAATMGAQGREYVRRNFLITRHLRDYLVLMLSCLYGKTATPLLVRDRQVSMIWS